MLLLRLQLLLQVVGGAISCVAVAGNSRAFANRHNTVDLTQSPISSPVPPPYATSSSCNQSNSSAQGGGQENNQVEENETSIISIRRRRTSLNEDDDDERKSREGQEQNDASRQPPARGNICIVVGIVGVEEVELLK